MAKLLAMVVLILSIVLFPPAVLAVISNNAVPGDVTYPVKRGLEDVIYSLASITPTSKAWFSAARSDRRFKEISILVTQGKQAEETLNELVEQTQATAVQINHIENKAQKAELIKQLSKSIEEYDKGLASLPGQVTIQPTPEPTLRITTAPNPTDTPRPTATIRPTQQPLVTATSVPTSTPTPAPTPTPTSPPSSETSPCDSIENPIRRARCELQRIQGTLGAEALDDHPAATDRSGRSGRNDNQEDHNNSRRNSSEGR